ncbi:hypothetical protein K1719_023679 [Acacia pycnantha]|nr:hypothetical protein K1719_023679 [Acacia pycnantha]
MVTCTFNFDARLWAFKGIQHKQRWRAVWEKESSASALTKRWLHTQPPQLFHLFKFQQWLPKHVSLIASH